MDASRADICDRFLDPQAPARSVTVQSQNHVPHSKHKGNPDMAQIYGVVARITAKTGKVGELLEFLRRCRCRHGDDALEPPAGLAVL